MGEDITPWRRVGVDEGIARPWLFLSTHDHEQDIHNDFTFLLAVMAFCIFVDKILFLRVINWLPSDATGRYFTVHVIINAYVTYVHFDDVLYSYWHATSPLTRCGSPTDTRGLVAILGLHLYHVFFFQPLPAVDWPVEILQLFRSHFFQIEPRCSAQLRPGVSFLLAGCSAVPFLTGCTTS